MRRIVSFVLVLLCASFVLATAAIGQVTGMVQGMISGQPPQGAMMTVNAGNPRRVAPAVTGMPYSAEQMTETVQTLADGTHIRQNERTTLMYRDSAGRTRTETPIGPPRAKNGGARMIRIVDAVGGYEYTLDDQNKIAHRVTVQVMQPMARRAAAVGAGAASVQAVLGTGGGMASARANAARPVDMPRPEMQSEDLGTQTIEGVTARGHRTTQTWPVDSVGNDRPIVVVFENWFSEQLGMPVLTKNTDPRRGETTTSLKNVSLAEPDPSLFQPPAGYQVVDESGSFQMAVPRPSTPAAQNQ